MLMCHLGGGERERYGVERAERESREKNMVIELVMPCFKLLFGKGCHNKTDGGIYQHQDNIYIHYQNEIF